MSIADTSIGPGARSSFPQAADTLLPSRVNLRQRSPFADAMWIVVPFLVLTLGLLATKPGLLRLVFPAATCAFGYRLYRKNEAYFLSFLLWIYMLAPLLRRLVDWKTFYQEQSYILLAPLLVTLIPAIDLRRRLMSVAPVIRSIALLALAGIAYGFGVGCIKHPGSAVFVATATWIAPIVLCIFAASIRERADLARVLNRTLLLGVLVTSIYGVYQFVVAPPWDTYWLKAVSADSIAPSFGRPAPYQIRVWSTMNAPGTLGLTLSAALIWLATRGGVLALAVAVAGYAALLLTLDRSAWLQTALGLALIFYFGHRQVPLRRMFSLGIAASVLFLGIQASPQASEIQQRFQSMSDLKHDASANERKDVYKIMVGVISDTPTGDGLDTTYEVHGYPLDSSFLVLFYKIGWLGALFYFAAFGLMLGTLLKNRLGRTAKRVAAAAIVITSLTQLIGGDILVRQGAILLWLSFGLWVGSDGIQVNKTFRGPNG